MAKRRSLTCRGHTTPHARVPRRAARRRMDRTIAGAPHAGPMTHQKMTMRAHGGTAPAGAMENGRAVAVRGDPGARTTTGTRLTGVARARRATPMTVVAVASDAVAARYATRTILIRAADPRGLVTTSGTVALGSLAKAGMVAAARGESPRDGRGMRATRPGTRADAEAAMGHGLLVAGRGDQGAVSV